MLFRSEFCEAFRDHTQLVVLESPSSVVFSVQDIRGVSELAKSRGARVYIDNTFCTPIYQKPLTMGADYVMHTTSKYMGGHSDLIGGVLTVKDQALGEEIRNLREVLGSVIGPMEGWLILRGMRTLEVRVKEHERVAGKVAGYLENHPKVKRVYYTGLKSQDRKSVE